MDPKYTRRTSTGNCSNEDVCKQGVFIKSPPLPLFNNQSSWKKRDFVLSKSSNGCFLKYHKGQHNKGSIEINERSKIEIGIGDYERMATVKRMFKCQPSEVMTIKTEERTYYLIGTDSNDIEEWANFLFAACKEKETSTWEALNQTPSQIASRNRSQSSPEYLSEYWASVKTEDLHEGNEYEIQKISADKKRPFSDPVYESIRKCIPRQRTLPGNHGICEEQTKGMSEKEEEEKNEQSYYATPRSLRVELNDVTAECNIPVENLNLNVTNGDQSGHYMPMNSLVIKEKNQPECTNVELISSCHRSQENSTNLTGYMGPQQLIEGNTGKKELPPQYKTKYLTVVQLSRLLSKITDNSQLEKVDILLPQNDAINCLAFTEAIGRICVSQWKAPRHSNCIFHQGDHILAVNDLHVTTIDEVLFFIKRSTRNEVKLTVHRLPDSEVFPC